MPGDIAVWGSGRSGIARWGLIPGSPGEVIPDIHPCRPDAGTRVTAPGPMGPSPFLDREREALPSDEEAARESVPSPAARPAMIAYSSASAVPGRFCQDQAVGALRIPPEPPETAVGGLWVLFGLRSHLPSALGEPTPSVVHKSWRSGMMRTCTTPLWRPGSSLAPMAKAATLFSVALARTRARLAALSMSSCRSVSETSARM